MYSLITASIFLLFCNHLHASQNFTFEASKPGTLLISHNRNLCEENEQVDPNCSNIVCEQTCDPDEYCPPCGKSCEGKAKVSLCYDYSWFPNISPNKGYVDVKGFKPRVDTAYILKVNKDLSFEIISSTQLKPDCINLDLAVYYELQTKRSLEDFAKKVGEPLYCSSKHMCELINKELSAQKLKVAKLCRLTDNKLYFSY